MDQCGSCDAAILVGLIVVVRSRETKKKQKRMVNVRAQCDVVLGDGVSERLEELPVPCRYCRSWDPEAVVVPASSFSFSVLGHLRPLRIGWLGSRVFVLLVGSTQPVALAPRRLKSLRSTTGAGRVDPLPEPELRPD